MKKNNICPCIFCSERNKICGGNCKTDTIITTKNKEMDFKEITKVIAKLNEIIQQAEKELGK